MLNTTKLSSIRISKLMQKQIRELRKWFKESQTKIIARALDRLYIYEKQDRKNGKS